MCELRKANDRDRKASMRAKETECDTELHRASNRLCQANKRAKETECDTELRRASNRLCQANKRADETECLLTKTPIASKVSAEINSQFSIHNYLFLSCFCIYRSFVCLSVILSVTSVYFVRLFVCQSFCLLLLYISFVCLSVILSVTSFVRLFVCKSF